MKRFIYFTFAALLVVSCTKTKDYGMSDCIAAKIEEFKTEDCLQGYSSVTEYTIDNELYYVFDYGAAADWGSYLLNNKCDTLCFMGTRGVPPCKMEKSLGNATQVKVLISR